MSDANPYHSLDTEPPVAEKTPAPTRNRSSGCLGLLVLGMFLFDTFGILIAMAGPYCHVAMVLGLVGFCGGAV